MNKAHIAEESEGFEDEEDQAKTRFASVRTNRGLGKNGWARSAAASGRVQTRFNVPKGVWSRRGPEHCCEDRQRAVSEGPAWCGLSPSWIGGQDCEWIP